MELQPPGVPVADPFLAAVRARLPDVDIVVLAPGAGPPYPPEELVGDDLVTAVLDDVRRRAGELWALVAGGEEPAAWLDPGPVPGTVVARSRHGVPCLPVDALPCLADGLADAGWRVSGAVGPGRPGGRLAGSTTGRAAPLVLDATYAAATGAMVVALVSAPLSVGRRRAHELVRS